MFTSHCARAAYSCLFALAATAPVFGDEVLFTNGPIITNPTGGTGAIAGLPISNADPYTVPGQPGSFVTTGVGETVASGTALADNFIVPEGETWDLSTGTFYAFQTGQSTPAFVTAVHVNLWTTKPYSADSPDRPVDVPVPSPVLAEDLVLTPVSSAFVVHRQSATSTTTNRPVFAFTVSLDGLPNGGVLPAGEYWMEWSFAGVSTQNIFTPLVTPRALAFDFNARLLNSVTGSATGPRVWFEGREGFVSGVTEGRAYGVPFELSGTVVGGACNLADITEVGGTIESPGMPDGQLTVDDLILFINLFSDQSGCPGAAPCSRADVTGVGGGGAAPDGELTVDDLIEFVNAFSTGC